MNILIFVMLQMKQKRNLKQKIFLLFRVNIETIDFIKYCRLNDAEHTYDVLADGDISVRSLHSFDIWMPVIWVASNILLPFAINMVCNYIAEKRKGREKEETQVDVTFIVKSKGKEKSLHYKGDAVAFKESFEKIDLNDM